MFSYALLHSTPPVASQIATSDSSGGSSTWIIIALVVIAAVWIFSAIGGSEPTVVVVQRAPGSFLGFTVIIIAVLILYFVYIAPGSGQA
jgi:hypothetical protein